MCMASRPRETGPATPAAPPRPHRGRWLRTAAVLATALAAALLSTSPATAWQLAVLDMAELPVTWKVRELSGLAWVPPSGALLAVSDRGRLWPLPVAWPGAPGQERLHFGAPPQPRPLATPSGPRPNAEALAWRPAAGGTPAALLVADEAAHRILALDLDGQPLAALATPGPADQAQRLRGANAGLEALAWHPARGLVVALQRPLKGGPAAVHQVQAADGHHWAFRAAGRRSSLKALEVLDATTLLVLERVEDGGALRAQLRPLALGGCGGARLCDAPALPLVHPALRGDENFEGLACVGDGLCLVVSDDGGSGRTLLLLLRLRR